MEWTQDCRGCMKKFKPRVRKYSSPKTMQMFYYCINKKFSENVEVLPKQFCYDCYNTIHSSFKFIKRARKAQAKFENLLFLCKTGILPKSKLCIERIADGIEETIKSNTVEIMISPKTESLSVADRHEMTAKGIASEYKTTSGNLATFIEPKPEIKQENTVTLEVKTQIKKEIETHPKLEFLTSEDDSDQNVDEFMAPNDVNFSLSESSDLEDKVQSQQRLLNKKPAKSLFKKQHECTKCTKKFCSKLWLAKHMRKDHIKINQCPKCTKTFSRQTTMEYHIKKNSCTKKTYDCEVCGRQFDSPRQLPGHMTKHVEYWTFSCDQCPRRFNKQSRLDDHLKLHKAGKVGREFLCSVCGTSFNNSGSLTIHMRLHTGERPYSCSDCPKTFSTSSGARKHEQTHRRNFYYTCDICQKRFTEKGSLDRHLRGHSGEHPYQCTYCECAFADNWKKKVHMMRAHNLTLDEIPRKKGGRPPFASKPIQADTSAAEIRTNVESQVIAPE